MIGEFYELQDVAAKLGMEEELLRRLLHAMKLMYPGRYGSMWPYASIPHSLNCEMEEVSVPATSRDGNEYMLRTTGISHKGIRLLQEQMEQYAKELDRLARIVVREI